MSELSCFELAGYSKDESEKLIEVCRERDMDYSQMLNFLVAFDTSKDNIFEELCHYGKSPLEIAWDNFITTLGESLGLYKVLYWLNNKLDSFKRKGGK